MAKRESSCQVCRSKDRAAIELARANGTSCRILESRYDLHKDAIWRHSTNHMSNGLKKRLQAVAFDPEADLDSIRIEESESLLNHLRAVRARLYRGIDNAEEFGNLSDLAKMSGQIHRNIELTGKLVGDLKTGTTINNTLILSGEYHKLRTGLIMALKPHPKARVAVTNLLQSLEAEPALIEQQS
ncbi:hypothetical protein ACFL07_00325 [Pseudomonadota bacterium]